MNYLHEYKTFDNVQELNLHVKEHTNKKYYDMNETQRQTLQVISQYSVKYCGASHLKVETIAKAINKSVSTIKRVLNALVKLKVIEKLSTLRRVKGGSGANIIRILPFIPSNERAEMDGREEVDKQETPKDSEPIIEKETAKLLSYKSINNTYAKPSNSPYTVFKSSIHTFLGDSISKENKGIISRLYGVYLGQTKALRKAYDSNELIEIASEAIRVTFTATKRKKLRNIVGYFNGVLSNMLDDLCEFEMENIPS